MKASKDKSTPCVVRDSAVSSDNAEGDIREVKIIDCVRKLMALGVSADKIGELDVRPHILEAICEYAQLDIDDFGSVENTAEVIKATLKTINEQMTDLDLELELLNLRKRALKKRTQILEKLARSLEDSDESPQSGKTKRDES